MPRPTRQPIPERRHTGPPRPHKRPNPERCTTMRDTLERLTRIGRTLAGKLGQLATRLRARGEDPDRARGEDPDRARVEDPDRARVEDPAQARVEDPAQARVEDPAQARVEDPAQARGEDPAQARGEDPAQARGEDPDPRPDRTSSVGDRSRTDPVGGDLGPDPDRGGWTDLVQGPGHRAHREVPTDTADAPAAPAPASPDTAPPELEGLGPVPLPRLCVPPDQWETALGGDPLGVLPSDPVSPHHEHLKTALAAEWPEGDPWVCPGCYPRGLPASE
jgi:hypothetical protein